MTGENQFPIYDKFDTAELSGKHAIRDLIGRVTGKPPTNKAMNMWAAYGRIPSKFILLIMRECGEKGIIFSDSDFNHRKRQDDGKDQGCEEQTEGISRPE